jgi:hydrogenase maturation protease
VSAGRIVVAGLGNPYRRDDGVGVRVAERLRSARLPDVAVLSGANDPWTLIECWEGADLAILVDATRSGSPAGALRRLDAGGEALPPDRPASSTHALGAAETVELARALGRLPARLVLFGIEGASFGVGVGLSPAAAAAVEEAVRRIREEIEAFRALSPPRAPRSPCGTPRRRR